ncbi:hypothetical protein [Candidatus Vondammii sp. HM_W22]|uniref:hypothetical protein n=1 Tax=Candidatus Vondammii sp. HM_W22 TaxID=2687299 RepID=UPI001F142617|nr:hypothetical protein [Candidatus Vondammii sp. HM_W22]
MRYIGIIAALLLSAAAQAGEPTTPRGIVFAYECDQVSRMDVGFTCLFDAGRLTFRLHTKKETMSPEQRKRRDYEFNKLSLRYMELDGKAFEIVADFWHPKQPRVCSRINSASFGCSGFTAE